MLTEDHILRQINQALAFLVKVTGLRQVGQQQEALLLVDQALEGLLGFKAYLLKQLDDEALLARLTFMERLDTDRLAVVADLYRQAGELEAALDRPAESRAHHARALRFYLEVALGSQPAAEPEINAKIIDLLGIVEAQALPVGILLALYDYLERRLEQPDRELARQGLSRSALNAWLEGVKSALADLDQT